MPRSSSSHSISWVTATDSGRANSNYLQFEFDTRTKRLVASNLDLNSISSSTSLWQSQLPVDLLAGINFYAAEVTRSAARTYFYRQNCITLD
jgi:hypothetical protein